MNTLHPYYDHAINSMTWLTCSLIVGATLSVKYDVCGSVTPAALKERATNHLSLVGVADLYRCNALGHLTDIRARLVNLGRLGGPQAVLDHLKEELSSREQSNRNSWASALYRALVNSTWFCGGGYHNIEASQLNTI